ncbi:MAG: dihydroorotate dehydrogenase electron transfer subunit [Vulcanibacillus sp.]
MNQYIMTVKENIEIAKDIYQIIIEPKSINRFSKNIDIISMLPLPGQYLHIRVSETNNPLLRRPISIHDYDSSSKEVSLIYRINGDGTRLLSKKKYGDEVDVLGPLGNGFSYKQIEKGREILLIGGGIGTPPLYYLAKELVGMGFKITTLLGFQTKEDSILVSDFSILGEVRISTIDGSLGIKGTVLNLINECDKWDVFYTCGPTAMMKAIQQRWIATEMVGYLSLEERMGCGVGACYGCVVKVDKSIYKEGFKKVCSDGPVFSFREVIL